MTADLTKSLVSSGGVLEPAYIVSQLNTLIVEGSFLSLSTWFGNFLNEEPCSCMIYPESFKHDFRYCAPSSH